MEEPGRTFRENVAIFPFSPHNFWLVVSTFLKNISQNGNLPQIGMKLKIFENKKYLKPPPRFLLQPPKNRKNSLRAVATRLFDAG